MTNPIDLYDIKLTDNEWVELEFCMEACAEIAQNGTVEGYEDYIEGMCDIMLKAASEISKAVLVADGLLPKDGTTH